MKTEFKKSHAAKTSYIGDFSQVIVYHNDHLATPQMLTSSNGSIVWSAEYESFGKATVGTSTIANNLRFPGQYFDGESGLHQNWNREYSPEIGRYGQVDPIGNGPDWNLFRYTKNSSLNVFDSKGLMGVRRFSKFLLEIFLKRRVPRYGNYCGPNWTGGQEGGTTASGTWKASPTDDLDSCCMEHDRKYGLLPPGAGLDHPDRIKADNELVQCSKNLPECTDQWKKKPINQEKAKTYIEGVSFVFPLAKWKSKDDELTSWSF